MQPAELYKIVVLASGSIESLPTLHKSLFPLARLTSINICLSKDQKIRWHDLVRSISLLSEAVFLADPEPPQP